MSGYNFYVGAGVNSADVSANTNARHSHDNKTILDDIEVAFTTVYQGIVTTAITDSDVGVANGVASLDSNGQLVAAQIPDSLTSGLVWQGVWDANTNTPTIPAAASGNTGYFYKVNVAGTQSVTGVSIDFAVGDWLISNGTVWEYVPNVETDATSSVKGVVQLAGDLGGSASIPHVLSLGNGKWSINASTGEILPDTNEAYGIGSASYKVNVMHINNMYADTIGIGTVSPNAVLEVYGNLTTAPALFLNNIGGIGSGIRAQDASDVHAFSLLRAADVVTGDLSISARGGIGFTGGITDVGATTDYAIYITNDGKLGIGTTTPSTTLHVDGTFRVSDGANMVLNVSTSNMFIDVDNYPVVFGEDQDYSIGYVSSDDTFRIADGSDLTTTPRIVIDSDGNTTILEYTKLGSDAPAIKQKYFISTCAAVGTNLLITHGLDQSKIIGASCMVYDSNNNDLDPPTRGNSDALEYYEFYIKSTQIVVYTGTAATNIAGQAVRILITYVE